MANYHCSVKNGKKGKALAHGNYIEGKGKYEAKSDVRFSESYNLPNGFNTAAEFWKAADKSERKNGRTYKEIEASLPREIKSLKQQKRIIGEFIQNAGLGNQPMTVSVHKGKDGNQPHMHLMFCERTNDGVEREDPSQFFKRPNAKNPEKGGCGKNREFNKKEFVIDARKAWEKTVNARLERLGHDARIDCRSLKDQGIDRKPQPKIGYAAMQIEKRSPGQSKRVKRFQEIEEWNEGIFDTKTKVETVVPWENIAKNISENHHDMTEDYKEIIAVINKAKAKQKELKNLPKPKPKKILFVEMPVSPEQKSAFNKLLSEVKMQFSELRKKVSELKTRFKNHYGFDAKDFANNIQKYDELEEKRLAPFKEKADAEAKRNLEEQQKQEAQRQLEEQQKRDAAPKTIAEHEAHMQAIENKYDNAIKDIVVEESHGLEMG